MDNESYLRLEASVVASMLHLAKSLNEVMPGDLPDAALRREWLRRIDQISRNIVRRNPVGMELLVPGGWQNPAGGSGGGDDETEDCPMNCGHRRFK